jgi:GNAT superfamily N-acetyltransferase
MDSFIIRPAEVADLPLLEADVAALFAEDSAVRDATISQDWPARHARPWLEAQMDDEHRVLLTARGTDHAGYLAAEVREANPMRTVRVAVLVSMYVRPSARSQGAGSALVTAFRSWAVAQGAERMSVTAYAANTDALRFYQRQGFEPHETHLAAAAGSADAGTPPTWSRP